MSSIKSFINVINHRISLAICNSIATHGIISKKCPWNYSIAMQSVTHGFKIKKMFVKLPLIVVQHMASNKIKVSEIIQS